MSHSDERSSDISEYVNVTYRGKVIKVKPGTKLSELSVAPLPCGGHGKCGKCKVKADGGLSPLCDAEKAHLSPVEISAGGRLACHTTVTGDCIITDCSASGTEAGTVAATSEVLTDGKSVGAKASDPTFSVLGVAVDVGTTTLAAKLVLPDGSVLSAKGTANPQAVFGADVISRIEAALAGKSDALAETILGALDGLISDLCSEAGRDSGEIDGAVITGNTAMLCLLTRISVEPLSHAPFLLPDAFGRTTEAGVLGLRSLRAGVPVYLPPCISAFVGADTVTALLASGICEGSETAMLADIGTNGEMALFREGKLRVCSTAAGPAFEGVGISMGMCGATGAIDKVSVLNGAPCVHVIGDTEPVGICGSGLIDAVAVLLDTEVLDETGYLDDDEAVIAEPVKLTQKDIRMVQLAKSAICAGLCTLMHEAGVTENDVTRLDIAGGFGNYLNKFSAGRIGLLPGGLVGKVNSIGNAALAGAEMLLTDASARDRALHLARGAETLELSTGAYFSEAYMSGMLFPAF